eukprot:18599-Heterococcus_DN1.PRE.2
MAALVDAEDPLQSLFALATRGSDDPAVISSVREWTAFYLSLEREGLVADQREEQTLQKLWDREALGATAFGRKGKPQLSLAKIHQIPNLARSRYHHIVQQAIDALYESPAVKEMEGVVSNLTAQLQDLGPLLDAWDIETFDKVQTGQLLNVLTKFEYRNNEATDLLSNKAKQLDALMTAARVRQLMVSNSSSDAAKNVSKCSSVPVDYTHPVAHMSKHSVTRKLAPPHPPAWQLANMSVIERQVARHKARNLYYPATAASSSSTNGTNSRGRKLPDRFNLCQNYCGRHGVTCHRAAATCRTGSHTGSIATGTTATALATTQEVAVVVVSAPQTGLPAKTKEALLRCYYAHRQLACSMAVCRALGTSDKLCGDLLLYYELLPARPRRHHISAIVSQPVFALRILAAVAYCNFVQCGWHDQHCSNAWCSSTYCTAVMPSNKIIDVMAHQNTCIMLVLLYRALHNSHRHIARETLRCFAELQEQSLYSIQQRVTADSIMIGDKGRTVKLGRITHYGSMSRTPIA